MNIPVSVNGVDLGSPNKLTVVATLDGDAVAPIIEFQVVGKGVLQIYRSMVVYDDSQVNFHVFGSQQAVPIDYTSAIFANRWLNAVYMAVFGRLPTAPECGQWWTQIMEGGNLQTVAAGILATSPYQTIWNQVAPSVAVGWMYSQYLGRIGSQQEIQQWVANIAAGETIEQVQVSFLAGTEFCQKVAQP